MTHRMIIEDYLMLVFYSTAQVNVYCIVLCEKRKLVIKRFYDPVYNAKR